MPSINPITIGITMGDPCGVGPELAILGASRVTEDQEVRGLIIGDATRLQQALELLQRHGRIAHSTTLQTITSPEHLRDQGDAIGVLDLCNVPIDLPDDASDHLARQLQEWVKIRLAAHEYPRSVEFVAKFPMTPSGKIQRRLLRDNHPPNPDRSNSAP